jgi:hypothetical protein
MFKKLLSISIITSLISCNTMKTGASNGSTTNNTLTKAEKKEGWQLLFDGKTFDGWHSFNKNAVGKKWQVTENGEIHLTGGAKAGTYQTNDGGDIVTSQEFDNFHLSLDWKINTCGNSGIIFYVKEDSTKYKEVWNTGPEMQVLDNSCHPDAKIIKHRAGDLYDLISCSKETVKPALEWNHAEIKSLNGKIDFYLNGENVVSTTFWDDNWRKMLAASKFKTMPDFATFKKGKIALQDHGDLVWYKNVKIRRL